MEQPSWEQLDTGRGYRRATHCLPLPVLVLQARSAATEKLEMEQMHIREQRESAAELMEAATTNYRYRLMELLRAWEERQRQTEMELEAACREAMECRRDRDARARDLDGVRKTLEDQTACGDALRQENERLADEMGQRQEQYAKLKEAAADAKRQSEQMTEKKDSVELVCVCACACVGACVCVRLTAWSA